jgi:hypothetical protein
MSSSGLVELGAEAILPFSVVLVVSRESVQVFLFCKADQKAVFCNERKSHLYVVNEQV